MEWKNKNVKQILQKRLRMILRVAENSITHKKTQYAEYTWVWKKEH